MEIQDWIIGVGRQIIIEEVTRLGLGVRMAGWQDGRSGCKQCRLFSFVGLGVLLPSIGQLQQSVIPSIHIA